MYWLYRVVYIFMYIYVPYSYLDGKNHGKIHGFRFSDFPNQWVGQGRVTNQPEMSIIFFAGDQREIDGLVRENLNTGNQSECPI